jgi:hypothetical protein
MKPSIQKVFLFFNLSIIFLASSSTAQQAPKIILQKCFGGSNLDQGKRVIHSRDGGYIACGYTRSTNGDVSGLHDTTTKTGDGWIVKFDASGKIQWQKCIGGTSDDLFNCIIQTSDNGFALAGSTSSQDGDLAGYHLIPGDDFWVVKLDSTGVIEWQICFGVGNPNNNFSYAYSIIQTPTGDYLIAGDELYGEEGCSNFHGAGDAFVVKN